MLTNELREWTTYTVSPDLARLTVDNIHSLDCPIVYLLYEPARTRAVQGI